LKEPLVSVVIPTYNSVRTIGTCLESVRRQSYPNLEVIVVDNRSRDGTEAACHASGLTDLKVITARSGMTQARNIGISASRGDFILSLDSDMSLTPDVIRESVDLCISAKVHAVIIPEAAVGEGFWAECVALEKTMYYGDPLVEAARFFRRRVFERIGGYDENLLAGEDNDLHIRVLHSGHSVGRVGSHMLHREGSSLRVIARKKFRYGASLTRYIRKRGTYTLVLYSPIRLSWLRNYRKLMADPVHAVGMVVIRIVASLASLLGMASNTLDSLLRLR